MEDHYQMSDFEMKSSLRERINEVNWEKVSTPNLDVDDGIDDYGDYAVIDNFMQFPDELLEALLSVPGDFLEKVAEASHSEVGKFPFGLKEPGVNQLIPQPYLTPLLFGMYKALVDTEFIPADSNVNMEGEQMKKFISQLPEYCSTVGNLMFDGTICNVNADIPSFTRWEHGGMLFLQDHPVSSFNLYNLHWKGKYYSNAEDIMTEDPVIVNDIADWLNENATAKEESKVYEPFKESEHFIKTRSVEVKKNRLVLFKGHTFRCLNYGGGDDLYSLILGQNPVPKAQQQQGNEFQNDDVYS